MDYASLWESIAQATLNFIVVNALTSSAQQRTITDVKTDLRTTKEDIMSELKDSRENILSQMNSPAKEGGKMDRYEIGDRVSFENDGVRTEGEIVCIYAVPKDYDLVDIQTEGGVVRGISTNDLSRIENES